MLFDIFFFFIPSAISSMTSGVEGLRTLLDRIETNRKIAIGVWNESDHPWEATSVYFSSGTSDNILPLNVPQGTN